MNTHADIAAEEALEPDAPVDPDGERAERLLRVLARLTDLGMALAEMLVARVRDSEVPVDVGEVGACFAKVSRGVRLTVMLEDRLAKDQRRRLDGLEAEHEARRLERLKVQWARQSEEDDLRAGRRQRAIRKAVRDVIHAERPEGFDRERLVARSEQLWKDDIETDLCAPPNLYLQIGGDDALVSEQIAGFCKALGLTPDWGLWKQSFWAREEAEDQAPGSPYAAQTRPPETGPPDG